MSALPPIDVLVTPTLDPSWPKNGLGSPSVILASLPDPASLDRGVVVGVSGGDAKRGLGKLFRATRFAHLSVRCAALLAKGYVDVGAGVDEDGRETAHGRTP